MTAAATLLTLAGVSKSYRRPGGGRVVAVEDASFTVDAGESVGLVGASGAGKSTVAGIIAGIVTADRGTVRFAGDDLGALDRRTRRQVRSQLHLVFQDPYASLAPGMSVAALVGEPLVIQRRLAAAQRREQVLDALEEVQLSPASRYVDRYPHELSGGERQRVALARAIILRPRLIIADEPTQMLDAALRADLVALLGGLQRRHGMAQLYITHDLALAQGVCERIVVMHHGRVVEQGPTAAVLATPAHPHTIELVDAVHRLHAPLRGTAAG